MKLLDISVSGKKQIDAAKSEPKIYEDGSVEVNLSGGRRFRQKPSTCGTCGVSKIDSQTSVESTRAAMAGLCVGCLTIEETARKQAIAAERADRRKGRQSSGYRRNIAQILATPVWRDRGKIQLVYDEAKRMTSLTGIPHEVDHIYPIQSEFGCGLHVHHNLQVLEKTHNRSKKNFFPLFDSPALWDDYQKELALLNQINANQAGS